MTCCRFILVSVLFGFLYAVPLRAQEETVPLNALPNAVSIYDFLKAMRVKHVITTFRDDNLNLSRKEVLQRLAEIEAKSEMLSATERQLVERFKLTFGEQPDSLTARFFDSGSTQATLEGIFSNREKLFYRWREQESNLFIEVVGNGYFAAEVESPRNTTVYDIGLRFRGTLFSRLGYNFTILKGAYGGAGSLATEIVPALATNFKFLENADVINNYDVAEGYLRYAAEIQGAEIYAQLGREPIKYGLGYGSRLVLSGEGPTMDFIKFGVNYGIVSYSSVHGSTVGEFNFDRTENYTKFFAANRFKVALKDLFDIGIGETVIYSGRGLDLAYLNPLLFYKFAEQSLQDRDNGQLFFDIQTHFWKGVELQGSVLLDETPVFDNADSERNKFAYQVGALLYPFAGIENLELAVEYTRIRPYVYTHSFSENRNTYSAFGKGIGHRIGPNADEIYARISYNAAVWLRATLEFQRIRKGENRVGADGGLLQNVGGDIFTPFNSNRDNPNVPFLDGDLLNRTIVTASVRLEPLKNYVIDIRYALRHDAVPSRDVSATLSYIAAHLYIEY